MLSGVRAEASGAVPLRRSPRDQGGAHPFRETARRPHHQDYQVTFFGRLTPAGSRVRVGLRLGPVLPAP